jgi:uncharacterized damage-inducible protein DinB
MAPFSAPARRPTIRTGSEREQLDAWLDFYRDTLLVKCADLRDEQLVTAAVATTSLTLLGILRHMAAVEWWWFEHNFAGLDSPELINSQLDPDADFNDLEGLAVAEVHAMFLSQVARSRQQAAAGQLDDLAARESDEPVNLRWIYLHMIEEYARHCGHADLIREAIDGKAGY